MKPLAPIRFWIALIALACVCAGAPAQTLRYVTDLPSTGATVRSSNPDDLAGNGTIVYFSAQDDEHGRELWVTDGTVAGTRMVIDLLPGTQSGLSSTNQIAVTPSGRAYFSASTPEQGDELFVSDGTAAGTHMVLDLKPGRFSSAVRSLAVIGEDVVFTANDGTNGIEIWRSDGTAVGTYRVTDIPQASNSLLADGPYTDGTGVAYFAFSSSSVPSLWRTDGTVAGTYPITSGSLLMRDAESFVTWSGKTYFRTNDGLFSLSPGSSVAQQISIASGTLYARATTNFQSTACVLPGTVLFSGYAYVPSVDNDEPWKTNGTTAGTSKVLDIVSGTSGSSPQAFYSRGQRAFFSATTTATGRELWSTDGTAAGTALVLDINPGSGSSTPEWFCNLGDKTLFVAADVSGNREPWITDGTAAGTQRIIDLRPGSAGSLSASQSPVFHVCGNKAVFVATTDEVGTELFVTDGTAAGTGLLKDFQTGTLAMGPSTTNKRSAVLNGWLFFVGGTPATGMELWKTDGTAAGTGLVLDVVLGSVSSSISEMTVFGSHVYFVANDGVHGEELWRTDGTPGGTVMVADIYPGASSSKPINLTAGDDRLYFELGGKSVATLREIWRTDGTTAGTVLVSGVPGTLFSVPDTRTWAALGNQLVFYMVHPMGSDGTAQGTVALTSETPPEFPDGITRAGNSIYYFGVDAVVNGAYFGKLKRTDGTPGGTQSVGRFGLQMSGVNRVHPLADGRVVFSARPESATTNPAQVWISDGTPQGTSVVREIASGPEASMPNMLGSVGNSAYFNVWDPEHGFVPWVTDGTEAGTIALAGFASGSVPGGGVFAAVNGRALLYDTAQKRMMISTEIPGQMTQVFPANAPPSGVTSAPRMIPLGSSLCCFFSAQAAHQLWIVDLCRADTNNSGGVTIDDLFLFFNAWFQNLPRGDFDLSGQVTIDDLFLFINAWFTGCG